MPRQLLKISKEGHSTTCLGISWPSFKEACLCIFPHAHEQDHNKSFIDKFMFVHMSFCRPPKHANYCSYKQSCPKMSSKPDWRFPWTTCLHRGEPSLSPNAHSGRCSASVCCLHFEQLNTPGLLCGYVIAIGSLEMTNHNMDRNHPHVQVSTIPLSPKTALSPPKSPDQGRHLWNSS